MSELKERMLGQTMNEYGCDTKIYLKSEADKVIAEKDKEIAELKAKTKEPSVPNRTCRKCGRVGTLMYMPIVKDERTYWNLYNNKGIDYVFCIQCAHCGEVAFVTKQTHEYELRYQKYKRCLAMAEYCEAASCFHTTLANGFWLLRNDITKRDEERIIAKRWDKWQNRWLAIAEKFKEAK